MGITEGLHDLIYLVERNVWKKHDNVHMKKKSALLCTSVSYMVIIHIFFVPL